MLNKYMYVVYITVYVYFSYVAMYCDCFVKPSFGLDMFSGLDGRHLLCFAVSYVLNRTCAVNTFTFPTVL